MTDVATPFEFELLRNLTIHGPGNGFGYSHSPSLEYHEGTFYVVWQGGPENAEGGVGQGIVGVTSQDYQTFNRPSYFVPSRDDVVYFTPQLWTYQGELRLWYLENRNSPRSPTGGRSEAYIDRGALMERRLVNGEWTEESVVFDPEEDRAPSPALKPISLHGAGGAGRVVAPLEYKTDLRGECSVGVLVSDDGVTFTEGGRVPSEEPFLSEPSVIELDDGIVVMHIRNDRNFPVVWRSVSRDGGMTWSEAMPTELRSWAKTCVRRLKSGRFLMVLNDDPDSSPQMTLRHRNEDNSYVDQDGRPVPKFGDPCERRQNLSAAISEDGLSYRILGRIDLASNGLGISYPDFVEVDDTVCAVSSRRTSPKVRRPNTVRGHQFAVHRREGQLP